MRRAGNRAPYQKPKPLAFALLRFDARQAMDPLKAKIDAVLRELRAWSPGDPPLDIDELAARHSIDRWVVQRLAESEGVIAVVPVKPEDSDADTQEIDGSFLKDDDDDA